MTGAADTAVSFGPFALVASERLLTRDGATVPLGARALDILLALVAKPGTVIDKRELMAQVWPDATVDEGSLRFHMANLRKALGDGKDGAHYITTLAGRGYAFVAPLASPDDDAPARPPRTTLPTRLPKTLGRTENIRTLAAHLADTRFVSIIGAGGVGKTTVAVAIGHDLHAAFDGSVLFVDLAAVSDPSLVASTIAALLGLSVQSTDPTPGLIAYLRDQRMLVILDNCEHVITATAILADSLFRAAPQLHILATSREALRVEGEHVVKLDPLPCPPNAPDLTAEAALTYPATQLFLSRAASSGRHRDLSAADAMVVADICRKLDGVPLAIELAAGRVDSHGLRQTASLLGAHLALLWPGQRTAPARQQSLWASLDWSYRLLSDLERVVLRRLAIFAGPFTIAATLAVVPNATLDQAFVMQAVDDLVAKSMLATQPGVVTQYRLLDGTRTYVRDIRLNEAETAELAASHARFYQLWAEHALAGATDRTAMLAALCNVRAALEWCLGPDGDTGIGLALAAAATPVFLAMSLLTDCHHWSSRAIAALDEPGRGGAAEMHLQAALGIASMFTRGMSDAAHVALTRSFDIAEQRGDISHQLQLLGQLHMFHIRIGDFTTALRHARHASSIAAATGTPAAAALAGSLLGMSLHLAGEQSAAQASLAAVLRPGPPPAQRAATDQLGFDHYNLAGAYLARTAWTRGDPAQAIERAHAAIDDAMRIGHPVTLSTALIWVISLFLWIGDLDCAAAYLDQFIAHAEAHSLAPYLPLGRGYRAELAIRRGDVKGGIEQLQDALMALHAAGYEVMTTPFNLVLAQALAAIGRFTAGLTLIDTTIRQVEARGDHCYMGELLRAKGNILAALPQPAIDDAAACFTQALDVCRRQGALAWELRVALDLTSVLAAQGDPGQAHAVLQPVVAKFPVGVATADLAAAHDLLAQWRPLPG